MNQLWQEEPQDPVSFLRLGSGPFQSSSLPFLPLPFNTLCAYHLTLAMSLHLLA
jgi:hypothetical protein